MFHDLSKQRIAQVNEKGEEDPMQEMSRQMNSTGHFSQKSDSMAFEDDEDKSTKFVILRKDNMELNGPIRRLNTSIHEYNEVVYCFGMFRKIKKTKKQQNQDQIDSVLDN